MAKKKKKAAGTAGRAGGGRAESHDASRRGGGGGRGKDGSRSGGGGRSNGKSRSGGEGRGGAGKLDPVLSLSVRRFGVEQPKDVRKFVDDLRGARRRSGSLIPPASESLIPPASESLIPPASASALGPMSESLITPASVRGMPVGLQGLMLQMSATGARRLAARDMVSVLVDTAAAAEVAAKVKAWRGEARVLTESTVSARVPRQRLRELSELANVKYVQASTRLSPHCDLAHGSASLGVGSGRMVPQTGTGVLVGVVDTGIDAAHAAFKSNGQTRIVNYLDQTTDPDKAYTPAQINSGAAAASPDEIGHGTHVAGIAAGNGAGSAGKKLAGVAPDADLAIVKSTFETADIAAGVAHIFELADQRQQPCVVNLSLGGHYGAHDGSSVLERTIDQLCGPGRLVVCSAGNEGGDLVHAGTHLPIGGATPARWTADIELRQQVVNNQLVGHLVVQVWHQHEDQLLVRLRSPNGELFAAPNESANDWDRGFFFVEAGHQRAVYSGDHSTTFVIVTVPQPQWLSGWTLIVEEDRSAGPGAVVGAVHAWILDGGMGRFSGGAMASHLVGMPGTAYSAITVASYATRKSWPSLDPTMPNVTLDAMNLEDISYFSSPGPTRDGQNKPDIAGPGQWLLAPLSSGASTDEVPNWTRWKDGPYAAMQGTSMSSPYVTGAMALLLEKHPSLDWAEARRRLIKSAKQDGFTGPCWNAHWGYGKLDVEALLTIEPL